MVETLIDQRFAVKGGGSCIYCGSNGGLDGLRDEHVIPYSLGGKVVLEKASCRDCEAVTSYLDGYLANAIFKDVRVHARVQSRRGHPATLKAHVALPEGDQVLDLAPKDHPYFLHMPVWDRPGMMRGSPADVEFRRRESPCVLVCAAQYSGDINAHLFADDGDPRQDFDAAPGPFCTSNREDRLLPRHPLLRSRWLEIARLARHYLGAIPEYLPLRG